MVVFGGGGGGGGRYTIKLRKTFERSSLIVPKVWQLELVIPSFFCFFLFVCLFESEVTCQRRGQTIINGISKKIIIIQTRLKKKKIHERYMKALNGEWSWS